MSPQAQVDTLTYRCPHCQAAVEVNPLAACDALQCPHCQRPFKVDLPEAKPVPVATQAPGHARGAQPAAVAAPARPAEPVRAVDKEELLAQLKLSMWRRYPLRCLAYSLAIVAGATAALVAWFSGWWVFALLCAVAAGLAALRFFPWWLRMCNTTLTITNLRLVLESGVWQREATELRREQIANIEVRQAIYMRWFDVGDLVISTNLPDHKQLVVMAVARPEAVAEILRAPRIAETQLEPVAAPAPVAAE